MQKNMYIQTMQRVRVPTELTFFRATVAGWVALKKELEFLTQVACTNFFMPHSTVPRRHLGGIAEVASVGRVFSSFAQEGGLVGS